MNEYCWDIHKDNAGEHFHIPDLTRGNGGYNQCLSTWHGWWCTRIVNHTGRCAAGDGITILAVWPTEIGHYERLLYNE